MDARKRTRLPRPPLVPAAALLLLLATLAGCGGNVAARRDGADAEVALLGREDLAVANVLDLASGVPVQGTLEPSLDVNVTAPFPELLDRVPVKEGQAVRRGQELARFRTVALAPAAASAEAQQSVAAADARRMDNLLREGAVSTRDAEAARAQLRGAEAQAALARKRLAEATVRAPFDGVVARRFVQTGDRVGDGDPLFRVVNTAELEFEASVPTEALGGVSVGAPVALTVSGLAGTTVTGRVSRVNATVDAATRQVKVYVTVPNPDRRLAGDMFATGRIVLRQARAVLAVPSAAVHAGGGSPYAWVLAGGRAGRRTLVTGLHDDLLDLVEVKSGLGDGDTVVVGPIENLTPGQPVRISDGASGPTAARAEQ